MIGLGLSDKEFKRLMSETMDRRSQPAPLSGKAFKEAIQEGERYLEAQRKGKRANK